LQAQQQWRHHRISRRIDLDRGLRRAKLGHELIVARKDRASTPLVAYAW